MQGISPAALSLWPDASSLQCDSLAQMLYKSYTYMWCAHASEKYFCKKAWISLNKCVMGKWKHWVVSPSSIWLQLKTPLFDQNKVLVWVIWRVEFLMEGLMGHTQKCSGITPDRVIRWHNVQVIDSGWAAYKTNVLTFYHCIITAALTLKFLLFILSVNGEIILKIKN